MKFFVFCSSPSFCTDLKAKLEDKNNPEVLVFFNVVKPFVLGKYLNFKPHFYGRSFRCNIEINEQLVKDTFTEIKMSLHQRLTVHIYSICPPMLSADI